MPCSKLQVWCSQNMKKDKSPWPKCLLHVKEILSKSFVEVSSCLHTTLHCSLEAKPVVFWVFNFWCCSFLGHWFAHITWLPCLLYVAWASRRWINVKLFVTLRNFIPCLSNCANDLCPLSFCLPPRLNTWLRSSVSLFLKTGSITSFLSFQDCGQCLLL